MKRILSTILSLVLVLSMIPMAVFANDAEAVLYTETEATTVAVGDTFEYSISISGTYDGYSVAVAKEFAGLAITVVGEPGVYIDDFGDYWAISIVGGLSRFDSAKTKIATATAVVGEAATGEIVLDFADDTVISSESGDAVNYGKSLASVTVVVPTTGVTLDKASATLEEGDTLTLVATVAPENATDKTVTWTSSDANVATVENGVVTAKSIGTATITATAAGFTAECVVVVTEKIIPVTGVTLNKKEATLTTGETLTLVATVAPVDATNKTVTWTSSDNAVATVSNGVVTSIKAGTATITATAGDFSATCEVTVKDPVLTFAVSDARATAGRTVRVKVDIKNNPGIAGMVLRFDYNTDVLNLVDYEISEGFEVETNFEDPDGDESALFFTFVKESNYMANGTFLTLIFEVNEAAELGDYVIEVSCPDDNVTNEELGVIGFDTVSGTVTVTDVIPGDAYSDGVIDIKDAIALAQFLAEWKNIENFDEAAADCYADGIVDIKDAVLLAQYLAEWQVELGVGPN